MCLGSDEHPHPPGDDSSKADTKDCRNEVSSEEIGYRLKRNLLLLSGMHQLYQCLQHRRLADLHQQHKRRNKKTTRLSTSPFLSAPPIRQALVMASTNLVMIAFVFQEEKEERKRSSTFLPLGLEQMRPCGRHFCCLQSAAGPIASRRRGLPLRSDVRQRVGLLGPSTSKHQQESIPGGDDSLSLSLVSTAEVRDSLYQITI